jgi:hypothetical protein
VERNVITYAATDNVTSYWGGSVGSGNLVQANCLWGAAQRQIESADGGFSSANNLITNPLFLDRASRDYRLALTSLCLLVVGYDTAAKLLTTILDPLTPAPAPAPAPTPTPTPTPTPAPAGAPTITLTSPLNGASFTRWLLLSANASDNTGIAKVEFLIDGKLVHTETGAPYYAYWSASSDISYGTHQIVAKAYDDQGNTTSTAPATITRVIG